MLKNFEQFLLDKSKSMNTVKSYMCHVGGYLKWHKKTFSTPFVKLYRANVLDYISYLRNIKKDNAKTINTKISALIQFNEFLKEHGTQQDMVISKKDNIKIQQQIANPCTVTKKDLEEFRQKILEHESKRDYAIATVMAYAGLRISETLNLKLDDVNLTAKEIIVRSGKGDKQRVVFINDKIVNAIKEYLKGRNSSSEYLFVSRQSGSINRSRVNQIFNKYSNKITPHTLRHLYCTMALEANFSIHEVANQAGHSNIHTTLLYTNPNREKMKEKANLL